MNLTIFDNFGNFDDFDDFKIIDDFDGSDEWWLWSKVHLDFWSSVEAVASLGLWSVTVLFFQFVV